MKLVLVPLVFTLTVAVGAARAQHAEVGATFETDPFFGDDCDDSDADNPAIWVHRA